MIFIQNLYVKELTAFLISSVSLGPPIYLDNILTLPYLGVVHEYMISYGFKYDFPGVIHALHWVLGLRLILLVS